LKSAYQNDLKTSKIYYFKEKKNQFFSASLLKSTPKLNYDNSPKFYIALVACDN
jgi:hypothetical protein